MNIFRHVRYSLACVAFVLGSIASASPAFAQAPDGDAILRRVDENIGADNKISTSEMIIHGRRATRTIKSKSWIRGRHRGERGRSPAVRTSWPNLCRTQAGMSLVPVLETKKLGALGSGQSASRRRA